MADTIARLIFEANTAELKKANDELKKLAQESGKAAKSVNDGTKAKKKSSDETTKLTNKEKLLAESLKKTGKETNKTTTATDKMVVSLKRASNAAAVMTGPLGGVSGRLSFLATGLDKFTLKGIAAGVGLAAIATILKNSIGAFAAYETQMFKLEAMTKATGFTAGFTSIELDRMAIAVGRDTLASASGIRDLQGVLLSFQSISGSVFKRAIAASVDLSAVMGQTAASAGKTLAKALEDPINNLSALTRAGVLFTDQEKEKIATLKDANKTYEAQALILDKIEEKMKGAGTGGGVAAAMDTLGENIAFASIQLAKVSGVATGVKNIANEFAEMFQMTGDFFADFDKGLEGERDKQLEKIKSQENKIGVFGYFFGEENESTGYNLAQLEKFQDELDVIDAKIAQRNADQATADAAKNKKPRAPDNFEDDDFEDDLAATQVDPLQPLLDKIAKEKELKDKAAADDQARKDAAAEKERVKLEETKAQNQIAAEEEMAQAAIYQVERQERLEEAALMEKELKDQLAQADIDRMLAAGEIETETALELHTARMERIKEEYEEKLEIIKENEERELELLTKKETQKRDILEKASSMVIKSVGKNLKRGLKDNKAGAIAGVAIDAAMGGAKILVNGAIQQASITTAYAQLAAATANPAIAAVGVAKGAIAMTAAKALAMKTAAITFGLGSLGVGLSGGGGGGGGGGDGGGGAAALAPVQPAETETAAQAPQAINVTVDGSIDPSGARRIIEAINEATEDGLQINAMVGS